MNTPAHLALSVFVWRSEVNWGAVIAVCIGALLPDLPMIGFYLYQKFWLGMPENIIWNVSYFKADWQLFFDLFNSIPIFLGLAIVFYFLGLRVALLLVASALLHLALDFPLHHDDAHRHFLPFSNWRFESPVSYWDSRHYGHIFIWIELTFALFACAYVGWKGPSNAMRIIACCTLIAYAGFSVFAFVHWA